MTSFNVIKNPIVKDLVTKIRDKETQPEMYRIYLNQISHFLIYEAFANFSTNERTVETLTNESYKGDSLSDSTEIVTILRAGLGMFIPAMELFPTFKFHPLGLKRNESDPFHGKPEFYLDRLNEISTTCKNIVILDPMLATGGSIISVLDSLRGKYNYKGNVHLVCLIAAQYGVDNVLKAYPDVQIVCAGLDKKLNDKGYIIPGLGDAGDRYFNTM
jgi:uracil phosphoribosyltransferase